MEISTKNYHNQLMSVKIQDGSTIMEIDVTNNNGMIPEELITQVKDLLLDLQDFNQYRNDAK